MALDKVAGSVAMANTPSRRRSAGSAQDYHGSTTVSSRDKAMALAHDVLYQLSAHCHVHWVVACTMLLCDCAHTLSLVLALTANLPWRRVPLVAFGINAALLPLSFVAGLDGPSVSYDPLQLFTASACIAAVMVVLLAWMICDGLTWSSYNPAWRARLLHLLVAVCVHGGFIPLIANLLSPWKCTTTWLDTGMSCFRSSHAAMAVASVLLLPVILIVVTACSLTVIPRMYTPGNGAKNAFAAAHGRVTALCLAIKAVMCLLYIFGSWHATLNGYVYVFLQLACISAIGGLHWLYLPYFNAWVNATILACCGAQVGACIAAVITMVMTDGNVASNTGAVLLLCLVPACAYCGASAANTRWASFNVPRAASNPFMAELRVRFAYQQTLSSQSPDSGDDLEAGRMRLPAHAREQVGLFGRMGTPVVDVMEALVQAAIKSCLHDPVMHLFAANFYRSVKRSSQLERLHLRLAQTTADGGAFDIHYFVYQRLRDVDEEDASLAAVSMTVRRRLEYEELLSTSRDQVANLRGLVLAFYTSLSERAPDASRVDVLCTEMNARMVEAHATFARLLSLSRNGAPVLRSYADFLVEIANDPMRASELLADAEQAEEDSTRERTTANHDADIVIGAAASPSDLAAEGVAILQVSSSFSDLGVVVDANMGARRLWGYNRRELMGRDIALLLPEPLASLCGAYLLQTVTTAEEAMLNTTRISISLHRAGFIFPCKLLVTTHGDNWAAVVEELPSSSAFIVAVTDAAGSMRVTAACKRSMATLPGLDAVSLRAGHVMLDSVIVDAHSSIQTLRQAGQAGAQVQLHGQAELDIHDSASGGASSASGAHVIDAHASLQDVPVASGSMPQTFIIQWRAHGELARRSASTSVVNTLLRGQELKKGHQPSFEVDAVTVPTEVDKHELHVPHPNAVLLDDETDNCASTSTQSKDETDILPSNSASSIDALSAAGTGAAAGAAAVPAALQSLIIDAPAAVQAAPVENAKVASPGVTFQRKTFVGVNEFATLAGISDTASEAAHPSSSRSSAAQSKAAEPVIMGAAAPGAPGSVHSRGSASTGTSVTDALRRGVTLRSSQLERSLVTLKRAVLFTFCCIAAMNVTSLAISRTLFSQLEANLQLVDENGDRGRHFQRSYALIQQWTLASTTPYQLREPLSTLQTQFDYHMETFNALHQRLFKLADPAVPEEAALYVNASIPVADLVPGSLKSPSNWTAAVRYVNLANAGFEFVNKASQIRRMNISTVSLSTPSVFWVHQNAWRGLRDGMNASMLTAFSRSASQANFVNLANVAVLAVAIVLLTCVALAVIVPASYVVNAEKRSTLGLLLEVPLPIVRALRLRSLSRIQASSADSDGDDCGEGAGEGEDDVDAVRRHRDSYAGHFDIMDDAAAAVRLDADDVELQLRTAVNAHSNRVARERAVVDSMVSSDVNTLSPFILCGCRRDQTSVAGSVKTRVFRTSSRGHASVLAYLLTPLAFYVLYYGGTYAWKEAAVAATVNIKSETLYTKQLLFLTPQTMHNTRAALTSCDPAIVNYALFRGRRAVAFVHFLLDALLYGNSDLKLRPGLTLSPAMFDLFTENGCVLDNSFGDLSGCSQHMGGLLAHGLASGLNEYLQAITALWDAHDYAVNVASNCVPHDFAAGMDSQLEMLAETYLAAATVRAARIRYTEGLQQLVDFIASDTAVTLLSVITLVLLYFAVYRRAIQALDREIKNARQLLLVFPDDVTCVIPAIVAEGRKLMASSKRGARRSM